MAAWLFILSHFWKLILTVFNNITIRRYFLSKLANDEPMMLNCHHDPWMDLSGVAVHQRNDLPLRNPLTCLLKNLT